MREHIDSLASGNVLYQPPLPCQFSKHGDLPCMNEFFFLKKKWCHLFAFEQFEELCRINEHQKVALDLDPYVKKLLNARRRVVLVNNILQNAQVGGQSQHLRTGFMKLTNACSSPQERLRRLHHNVAKETARRKTMLEASGVFSSRSPNKP